MQAQLNMDLFQIKKLKQQVIGTVYTEENGEVDENPLKLNIGRFQTSIDEAIKKPEKRIAIGYSKNDKGNFKLEIIVDKENEKAHRAAMSIQEQLGNDLINVQVIATAAVPTKRAIMESPHHKLLCEKIEGPLHIGISISHSEYFPGTLGAFVLNSKNKPCLLSCNHVLAKNGEICDLQDINTTRIYHPGNVEDHIVTASEHIANVEQWVVLRTLQPNSSDSAYARILDGIDFLGNVIPKGFEFAGEKIHQAPDDFVPYKGSEVYKIGRSTGLTKGIINSTSLDGVTVRATRNFVFDNLIMVDWQNEEKPFSAPGDSGSLTFVRENGKFFAIGILFAAASNYSYVCTMKDILKQNKITYYED